MIVAWCLAIALTSCGPAQPTRDHHVDGPTFVSLNPCLDAILVEVADPKQILALSHYSRDPASTSLPPERAEAYAFTGGTAEEVLALEPDIVLASTFIAPNTRAAFERLGIRVETFDSPTGISESIAQVRRLAELTEQGVMGERLVQAIERSALEEEPTAITTLLWQPGQIVPGETTLINELMTRNGFVSHSRALGLKQADHVTLERILSEPPELLLIAGDSAGQTHPLLEQLDGMRVETIEPRLLYCGARTIVAAQVRLDAIRTDMRK